MLSNSDVLRLRSCNMWRRVVCYMSPFTVPYSLSTSLGPRPQIWPLRVPSQYFFLLQTDSSLRLLPSWRWRQEIPSKRWYTSAKSRAIWLSFVRYPVGTVTWKSNYSRGFGLDIAFIVHFNKQLVITLNHTAITNFHTLQITLSLSSPLCLL
jgi:hypothetical protein